MSTHSPIETRSYRVTFLNIHNGTRYTVDVESAMIWLALKGAQAALAEHVARTAGHVSDWSHYSTAER